LKPDDAGYIRMLVRTLAETGHTSEAIAVCEGYLKHTPSADYYTFLGVLYAQNGQLENAQTAFRTAVQIDPGNAEAKSNLARANALLGKAASHAP
jgi:Flp pilus assembly protein TadD